jgi:enterochelin esterase family protein
MRFRRLSVVLLALLIISALALAQAPAQAPPAPAPAKMQMGPQVTSPEVLPDRRIVFRILAPNATSVTLRASDIPGMGGGAAGSAQPAGPQFAKGPNGVWEATIGPINPGAYRYTFVVDGVTVMDPRNSSVSESNGNAWSLVYVPGSDFMDTKQVPHGAVASVTYWSTTLNRFRRMHVYTPPGYELGGGKYPVFYLLHGAGDCDDSWTSVGRAGFILDNLIAAKKAKPMIVVMPAGHTGPGGFGARGAAGAPPPRDSFLDDFTKDIVPYINKNYRVLPGRANTAIAGLSMGGNHTLNIAIPDLDKFAYIGVFSSGLFNDFMARRGGAAAPAAPAGPTFEQQHQEVLDNANLKKGLKLFWFATGVDDGLITTTRATVDMLKKHGFNPVFKETPGAHTWIVWREYLNEFAPLLFQ